MKSRSRIKKHGLTPHLYIDEVSGIFLARVYHGGGTQSRSLKTKSEVIAKKRLSGAIKYIVTEDKSKLATKLLREYYEGFHKTLVAGDLSKSTMTRYSVSWRHHVEPFWGNLKEEHITQDAYAEFVSWHRANNKGRLFNHAKLLRGLFKYMLKAKAQIEVIDVYIPKKEKDETADGAGVYIETSEYESILKTLDKRDRVGLIIRLAHTFGFRIGELANLKKDRIKIVGGKVQVHLRSVDTKTRKPRMVPLTQELSDLLIAEMRLSGGDYVFPGERNAKRPTSKQVIERAWIKAKEAAGITRAMRFHDLRHTAATNFANREQDPVKVCALLGMSKKIYTKTYIKPRSLNLSSIVDDLEGLND